MGEEEMGFSQKWDFRRKENSSVDSLDDDPESNSSHGHEPVIKKHKPVSQLDKRTATTTGASRQQQQPGKTSRSSSQKGKAKNEKAKETGEAARKSTRGEEGGSVKKRKRVTKKCKPDDDSVKGIGVFMETLLDDLKASRESLFGWMSAEICKLDGENVSVTVSRKKETRTRNEGKNKKAQLRRPRRTVRHKKVSEGEKKKKRQARGENQKEKQSNSEEKIAEKNVVEVETGNVCGQDQEQGNAGFDCNVGPLERFLRCDEATDSQTNYYFQPQNHQEYHGNQGQFMKPTIPNDEEKAKNWGSTSIQKQKSLVLGICAQKRGLETPEKPSRGKKTTTQDAARVESMALSAETQKDRNFETPIEPKLSSSSLLMPVASSLCSSSFLSNPGIASFPSNNFHLRPLPLSLIQHSTENQAGSSFAHQGSRNLNSLYPSSAYFQGFISSGVNFPTQVSSDNFQRDNGGNMFGGPRMAGGAMRFSGGVLPEQFSWVDFNNNISNYRTNSSRQMQFQSHNITDGNASLFQN